VARPGGRPRADGGQAKQSHALEPRQQRPAAAHRWLAIGTLPAKQLADSACELSTGGPPSASNELPDALLLALPDEHAAEQHGSSRLAAACRSATVHALLVGTAAARAPAESATHGNYAVSATSP